MKLALIAVGALLILGGVNALVNPKARTLYGGASKYGATSQPHTFSAKSGQYFGAGAVSLAILSVIAGARYTRLASTSENVLTEKTDSTTTE